jgi:hypothetical protein
MRANIENYPIRLNHPPQEMHDIRLVSPEGECLLRSPIQAHTVTLERIGKRKGT